MAASAPPVVVELALLLGPLNLDEWTALADRVPEDLPTLLKKQPAQLAAFIREVSDLTPEQRALAQQVRRLKKGSVERLSAGVLRSPAAHAQPEFFGRKQAEKSSG